jgi:DNA-binding winged helix-turn-helix (wHTH) protein
MKNPAFGGVFFFGRKLPEHKQYDEQNEQVKFNGHIYHLLWFLLDAVNQVVGKI